MDSEAKQNGPHGEWETPTKSRIKAFIKEGVLSIRGAARRFGGPNTVSPWYPAQGTSFLSVFFTYKIPE